MPSQGIRTPFATGAVDRLTLTVSSVRGSAPAILPCPQCTCNCFNAEPSFGYNVATVCFEAEPSSVWYGVLGWCANVEPSLGYAHCSCAELAE
jgi:hypothetical protein